MVEIVGEFLEGSDWAIQYRLWQRELATTEAGDKVPVATEPIVRIPVAIWLRANDDERAALRVNGLAFSRLHYPDLVEEMPTDGTDTDASGSAPADGGDEHGSEPTDADQPAARRERTRDRH